MLHLRGMQHAVASHRTLHVLIEYFLYIKILRVSCRMFIRRCPASCRAQPQMRRACLHLKGMQHACCFTLILHELRTACGLLAWQCRSSSISIGEELFCFGGYCVLPTESIACAWIHNNNNEFYLLCAFLLPNALGEHAMSRANTAKHKCINHLLQ